MLRYLFIIALVLLAGVPALQAQSDPDAVTFRASQLIDSTMASLNLRAQRFNEELAKVNALKPLDVSSLNKETIPKNRQKIKDFLAYLDLYRSLSAKLRQQTEDSVSVLKAAMPSKHRAGFLKEFYEAYDMDQSAFDKYTLSLTTVFTTINDVLSFIESSTVTIKDNKLQFGDKKEYETYSELISNVQKSDKKLVNASATSQKATIDASAKMQKAYGSIKK